MMPLAFLHLVDDAAIFPPGLMPLDEAVVAHVAHQRSNYADLVGPFIVDTGRLDELLGIVRRRPGLQSMAVSVVVPSPADVQATVSRTTVEGLDLAGLEVKLDEAGSLTDQVSTIASAVKPGTRIYVEVPRPTHPEWHATLEALASRGLMAKFRTGGTTADAFPDERDLATWIVDAVGAGVAFKCTAGLHLALRHTDRSTGLEHHGFLNVMMATVLAVEGADVDTVGLELAERDGGALMARLRQTAPSLVTNARERFRSYGSCSIAEPRDELAAHGLIPMDPPHTKEGTD